MALASQKQRRKANEQQQQATRTIASSSPQQQQPLKAEPLFTKQTSEKFEVARNEAATYAAKILHSQVSKFIQ